VIRERTDEDLDELVAVLARVHTHDDYPTHWPGDPAAWLTPRNMVRAWVAEVDGRVVGHAVVGDEGGQAWLHRLFVDPDRRGAGAGKALMDKAKRWARANRAHLMLEVRDAQTDAIALYERTGWRRTHSGRASWDTRLTVHFYELAELAELVEVNPDAPLSTGEGEQHRAPVGQ
jgi:[ribosomal protein S18]-alanine N-acetyltransferase